jgi:hypothetical protein
MMYGGNLNHGTPGRELHDGFLRESWMTNDGHLIEDTLNMDDGSVVLKDTDPSGASTITKTDAEGRVISETHQGPAAAPQRNGFGRLYHGAIGTDLTFGALPPGRNPPETLRSNGYHLLEFDH